MLRKFLTAFLVFVFACNGFCFAKQDKSQYDEYKARKKSIKNQYKMKKRYSESGYMTVDEYEKKSKVKDKSAGNGDFIPKVTYDKMKYVPQPKYKLTYYNNPVGSVELNIDRKLHYNRQDVLPGIISPNHDFMIVPILDYYPQIKSTECDLYVVYLKNSLSEVDRVVKANIAQKNPEPIMSTPRYPVVNGLFRSLTPVDFSSDLKYLAIKQKTGHVDDGIWQTDLYIYDFNKKKLTKCDSIRDAVRYYWQKQKGFDLKDVRWDITPLGFDSGNPDRVIVKAYAYTGKAPDNLGYWSVDVNGEQVRLESLYDDIVNVSMVGLKLEQDGVKEIKVVRAESKAAKKEEKKEKNTKTVKKELKKEYKNELNELKNNYKK